jgi:hypothetical protein
VTVRTVEVGSHRGVAAVAQLGLRLGQQVLLPFFGVVGTVTVEATYVIAGVGRARRVAMRLRLAVALEAAPAGFFAGQFREADNLRLVPAARHVLAARPVAGFTAVAILLCGLKVRCVLELFLVNVFMTGHADINTGIRRRR